MTTKTAAKKKKVVSKKVPAIHADTGASTLVDLVSIRNRPIPVMKTALISAVDDPKQWAVTTGRTSSDLPKSAKAAANLSGGNFCFFCGKQREPVAKEELFHFHPEYPLCDCLMPNRKVNHEYIGWSTPEGGKALLDAVASGSLDEETPVYQFVCSCDKKTPVVVTAGSIAITIQQYGAHRKRTACARCTIKSMQNRPQWRNTTRPSYPQRPPPRNKGLTAKMGEMISTPQNGPGAKVGKHRKHKDQTPQAIEVSFPKLEQLDLRAATPEEKILHIAAETLADSNPTAVPQKALEATTA